VLAFAFGLMLGFSLDGVPAPVEEAPPAYAGPARPAGATRTRSADEPVTAERRYANRPAPAAPAATPTEETAQTQTRTRTPTG
jgi:hypothetical protein